MNNIRKGNRGEDIASEYLFASGHRILDRNYWTTAGEIDIISVDPQGSVHFHEVKTAHSRQAGEACARVNRVKQRKICRSAEIWCSRNLWSSDREMQFDVIALEKQQKHFQLWHWQQAFIPF